MRLIVCFGNIQINKIETILFIDDSFYNVASWSVCHMQEELIGGVIWYEISWSTSDACWLLLHHMQQHRF